MQDAPETEAAVELSSDEEADELRHVELPLFARLPGDEALLETLGAAHDDISGALHAEVSAGLESHAMKKWRKKSFCIPNMSSTLGSSVRVVWGEALVTIVDVDALPRAAAGDYIQFSRTDGSFDPEARVLRIKAVARNIVMLDRPFDMGATGTRGWRKWTPTESDRRNDQVPSPVEGDSKADSVVEAEKEIHVESGESGAKKPRKRSTAAPDVGAAAAQAALGLESPAAKPPGATTAAQAALGLRAPLAKPSLAASPASPASDATMDIAKSSAGNKPRKRSTAREISSATSPEAGVPEKSGTTSSAEEKKPQKAREKKARKKSTPDVVDFESAEKPIADKPPASSAAKTHDKHSSSKLPEPKQGKKEPRKRVERMDSMHSTISTTSTISNLSTSSLSKPRKRVERMDSMHSTHSTTSTVSYSSSVEINAKLRV